MERYAARNRRGRRGETVEDVLLRAPGLTVRAPGFGEGPVMADRARDG